MTGPPTICERLFALVSGAVMARRSLRPHLNQIRGWVRQGRTDAWIAHQLEVTVQQIEAFKRENDLAPESEGEAAPVGGDFDDEIDLRAEDDALIAAELEAEQAEAEAEAEAAAAAGDAPRGPARRRWRAPSTTARRATACGSTPRSRTTRSTPSTGPATVR